MSETCHGPFTFGELGKIECFDSHIKVHNVAAGPAIVEGSRVFDIHDSALIFLAVGLHQPQLICGRLTYVGEASKYEDSVFEVGFA